MLVNTYQTSGGKDLIFDFIDSLPSHERADIKVVLNRIEAEGLEALEILNTRQLIKKLWEIKIAKNRFMYVIADKDNIYILHACRKQKGKAELQELNKAKIRAKELEKLLDKKFI